LVVVGGSGSEPLVHPAALLLRGLDRGSNVVVFDALGTDQRHEYSMSLGPFIDCWADASGEMLVVDHGSNRTMILPVTVGDPLRRVVGRS
jgi:hypothetical protein